MLGWLAAAAAPILIHLWMRHTHRDTRWAAMEFLREAIKRNARRLKLQQWLLLAVRTLLLLLLAFAAAKPYLSGWNLLTGGPKIHRVLVLDGSMSMQYKSGDQSLFDRAKQYAVKVIESGNSVDLISVCLLAGPPQTIVAGPIADARRASAQIASLEPTYGRGNLSETLAVVKELIDDSADEASVHEVVFFTELAAHSWHAAIDQPATIAQIEDLANLAKLTVVDVGAIGPENVSVGSLRLAGSLPTTAGPVRLECEVANHGPSRVYDVVVQLVNSGVAIDEQSISLPAGGTTTVAFDVQLAESGWQTIAVRTPSDNLAADDVAWLTLDVKPRVRVLLVEGAPGAAKYLQHALNPGGQTSPIEATVIPEGALVETPLDDFDVVFLCNVARITQGERDYLHRYVVNGGNLVLFLGDRILPEVYNDVLAQQQQNLATPPAAAMGIGRGQRSTNLLYSDRAPAMRLVKQADAPADALLPAEVGELRSSEEFGLDPLDYRHPIAAAFRGSERAGLLSTPVSRYYELKPSDAATVALALPSGDPFLVTAPCGDGMVAVIASSASLDTIDPATVQPWTMLPAWPSFLPIVRELVVFGLEQNRDANRAEPGMVISGALPPTWAKASVDLLRPDGRVDSVPVVRGDGIVEWSYTSTDLPGAYTVLSTASNEPLSVATVNVPGTESGLTRVATDSLPDSFQVQTTTGDLQRTLANVGATTDLHRWLLYAVLALLLIESVMAWAFAGRAA